MRTVQILVSCDRCIELTGEKVPAVTTVIFGLRYGGAVNKCIELCEQHASEVTVAQLEGYGKNYAPTDADRPPRAATFAAGGLVSKPKPAETKMQYERTTCPFCRGRYESGRGIAVHIKHMHPEFFQVKMDWTQVTFDGKTLRNSA